MIKQAMQKAIIFFLMLSAAAAVYAKTDAKDDYPSLPGMFDESLEVSVAVMQAYEGEVDREELEKIINIGNSLVSACDYEFPFIFNIAGMQEPNAFALPGGMIFVTRGMLKIGLTDDEMAHLLGHEMAHVIYKHSVKMNRKAGLLTALHQALLVGILLGMSDDSGHRVGDPAVPLNRPQQGLEGKSAAFMGTMAFGQILQDLLQRGFSREYEKEADDMGFDLAVSAGYSPEAGVGLLQKLHDRIHEAPGMSYWRTHPYFKERLISAEARLKAAPKVNIQQLSEKRIHQLQQWLLFLSEKYRKNNRETPQSLFLLKSALNLAPGSPFAPAAHVRFFDHQLHIIQKKSPFLRNYGKIIEEYASVLETIEEQEESAEELDKLQKQMTQLKNEKAVLLDGYIKSIEEGALDTEILERFLDNFPESEHRYEVYYKLGESYRLKEQNSEAAEMFLKCPHKEKENPWRQKSLERLSMMAPKLTDPSVCRLIMEEAEDEDLRSLVDEKLPELVKSFDSMEEGKDYMQKWPDDEFIPDVKARLNELGTAAYRLGRQLEAVGRHQKAVGEYNRIIENVASDELLMKARRRLEYLQNLNEESNDSGLL